MTTQNTKTMKKKAFNYYDSESGMQKITFEKLSDLIKYIEDFNPKGESIGTIFEDSYPIMGYVSNEYGLNWIDSELTSMLE